MRRHAVLGLAISSATLLAGTFAGCGGSTDSRPAIQTRAALGRALFHDTSLSNPPGQACATCHQDDKAFTDPRPGSPTSQGVLSGIFGSRQAPSVAYASFSPEFSFSEDRNDYIGGQFWDGRAKDLQTQAKGPILNAAEMNNEAEDTVVAKLKSGTFANDFRQLFGNNVFDTTESAMSAYAAAIEAFEKSAEVAPFSSKYDAYLAGNATLLPAETRGLNLFNGKGRCNSCHPSGPGPRPLFTDFSYSNLGLPKNPNNRFYGNPSRINPKGSAFIDEGLYNATKRPGDRGRFKTPTLRNIAKTGPYYHNGIFDNLTDVIQFYNKRDLGGFAPAEVPDTKSRDQFGDLKLTDQEVSDMVAFLGTLTDGYTK